MVLHDTFFSFSYKQEEYNELTEGVRRYLNWSGKIKTWSYDECKITLVGMDINRIRVVLRRRFTGHSSFMKSDFSVNLMMGIIVLQTFEPENKNGKWEIRFKIQQSNDSRHRDLSEVKVYSENKKSIFELFEEIKKNTTNPPINQSIISDDESHYNKIMPVIYQPRIDAWKNFLREIHVAQISKEQYEITLVFQDEQLRRHFILDFFYRVYRFFKYQRIVDIENFYFHKTEKGYFTFPGIFSGDSSLFDDSVHFDKPTKEALENRFVKYFYKDEIHPIVFVNTSNHALSPEDNNHDMWKWEYIPWKHDIPIKMGDQTRENVEKNQKLVLRKELLEK